MLSVELNGEAKAYPIRILMWHEIVNDTIGGEPVSVTYCPLCNTGVAFRRPTIDGELLDFGTSGRLFHSNLVMYDRQTGTYWSQATLEALVGPLAGRRLEFIPAQIVSWGDWRAAHPTGRVLAQDTGFDRAYGQNPYRDTTRLATTTRSCSPVTRILVSLPRHAFWGWTPRATRWPSRTRS